MARILLLLGWLFLSCALPALAADIGLYVREGTPLNSPVEGKTWVFDATNRTIKVYDGTSFVPATVPQPNLTATAAPTINDDASQGWLPGAIWLDTVGQKAYICLDNSVGAAVWFDMGGSGGGGGGSVTSVGLAMPSSMFGVANSPITSSGTITVTLLNQNAATVFAGPASGGAGLPTFRALQASDLPVVDIAHGGTGQGTAAAAFNALAPSTSIGGLIKGTGINTYGNLGMGAPLQVLRVNSTQTDLEFAAPQFQGTVTSVALSMPSQYSVSGSPITSSGTLSVSWASQSQNLVLASPDGAAGVPTFRALLNNDLPVVSVAKGGTGASDATTARANLGAGTVNSVALAAPTQFTVTGSPVTDSGTLTLGWGSQQINKFLAGPVSGAADVPTFRSIDLADLPTIDIPHGGTGATTAASAFSALAPATGIGGLIVGTGTNTYGNLGMGTALQKIRVKSDASGLEWFSESAADANAKYLVYNTEAGLPNSRVAFSGDGIVITVGSSQATWAVDSSVIRTNVVQTITSNTTMSQLTVSSAHIRGLELKGSTGFTVQLRSDPTSNFVLTIPDIGTNANVVLTEGNVTLNGAITVTQDLILGAGLKVGGSTVTVPAGPETLVGRATTDELSNKTLVDAHVKNGSRLIFDYTTNNYSIGPGADPAASRQYNWYDAGANGDIAIKSGTPTAGGIAYGDGGLMKFSAAGTAGKAVMSGGSGAPTIGTLGVDGGGTGLTGGFTKGDLLVATGATTLINLGRGADGDVLKTNSATTSGLEWAAGGNGTVTSVGLTMPSVFGVSVSPITTSGSFTVTWNSQSGNLVFASPNGSAGTPTFRALDTADLPTIPITKGGTGQTTNAKGDLLVGAGPSGNGWNKLGAGTNTQFLHANSGATNGVEWSDAVTSVALSAPSQFSVSGSPITTAGTLTLSWANQNANTVLAGPSSGSAAAPTFRKLAARDGAAFGLMGGRLTLTSGTPVTTSDVLSAETVYYSPYTSNIVTLYDGTDFGNMTFSEVSVSVPATTDTPFDIFGYDNSGSLALETVNWTNDTTRATAVVTVSGVCCFKSGDTTRRLLGTCRTTGTSGKTEDSAARRYVWNMHNRVPRYMQAIDTTDSWTYNGPYREANGGSTDGTSRVSYIVGLNEDAVTASVMATYAGPANTRASVAIGVDSTTTKSGIVVQNEIGNSSDTVPISGSYKGYPGLGKHSLHWLETSNQATTTWYGDNAGTTIQSGLEAECRF